ncbi:DUF5615 family PIN-like protein [Halochromatium roseum]|uniref:DUF5615 family PIN-like protein n=1 Tax=Halochromatium roseum TaxID=391920 RepID=UPI001912555D
MTLRLVIDVNLSPEWVPILSEAGFEAVHWTEIGDPSASDRVTTPLPRRPGVRCFAADRAWTEPSASPSSLIASGVRCARRWCGPVPSQRRRAVRHPRPKKPA